MGHGHRRQAEHLRLQRQLRQEGQGVRMQPVGRPGARGQFRHARHMVDVGMGAQDEAYLHLRQPGAAQDVIHPAAGIDDRGDPGVGVAYQVGVLAEGLDGEGFEDELHGRGL